MREIKFVAIIVIMAIPVVTHAQISIEPEGRLRIPDSAHVQMLYLTDGTMLVGRITEITDDNVTFEADIGLMTIEKTKIRKIKEVPVSSMKEGAYWFPNPNYTRLFFAPTARPLKKGDGYFADYFLFFPMVAYGLTDNFTIAGGMSILPFGDFFDDNILYFTPKVGFQSSDAFAFSLGLLLVKLPSFGDETAPAVGVMYGLVTAGSSNSSITAGLGYGFVDWEFADRPLWVLGGEHRVSRNIALVTENWFIPGADNPLISYGFRFFGEKLSVDLAFINVLSDDAIFPGIPYIDFAIRF